MGNEENLLRKEDMLENHLQLWKVLKALKIGKQFMKHLPCNKIKKVVEERDLFLDVHQNLKIEMIVLQKKEVAHDQNLLLVKYVKKIKINQENQKVVFNLLW